MAAALHCSFSCLRWFGVALLTMASMAYCDCQNQVAAQEADVAETADVNLEDVLDPEQLESFRRFNEIKWQEGPATALIGQHAEIKVPAGYKFAAGADAQTLLELYGNPRNPRILGALMSTDEETDWTLIFQFDDIGYVKDADKESIDAGEILSSFQAGLSDMNAQRRAVGAMECTSITWKETPFYDPQTNNLTWALNLGFADGDSVNYDIRMLGRKGVMEATLLGDPETYTKVVPEVKTLLAGYAFTSGNKYAEWKQGDKIAAYGLSALVAGGGVALAAKSGLLAKLGILLAKGGKAIIVGIVVFFGAIGSFLKRMLGGGGGQESSSNR